MKTWQHDETGRTTTTEESPGPRWIEVPPLMDGGALLRQALEALEYHREQTRPIAQTDAAIAALRAYMQGTPRPDYRAECWPESPHNPNRPPGL